MKMSPSEPLVLRDQQARKAAVLPRLNATRYLGPPPWRFPEVDGKPAPVGSPARGDPGHPTEKPNVTPSSDPLISRPQGIKLANFRLKSKETVEIASRSARRPLPVNPRPPATDSYSNLVNTNVCLGSSLPASLPGYTRFVPSGRPVSVQTARNELRGGTQSRTPAQHAQDKVRLVTGYPVNLG